MNRVTFWYLSQLKNFPSRLSRRGREFPSENYSSAIDSPATAPDPPEQPATPELHPDQDTLPHTDTDESLQDQKPKDMPKRPPNDIFLL